MGLIDLLFKDPMMFVVYLTALIYAITIHEFFHAYVAYKAGDDTQIENKRLSLNPLRHLDITGMITLILLGIGWGKSVSIDIRKFNPKRFKFYLYMVSFAGILSNIVSALFFAVLLKIILVFGLADVNGLLIKFFIILIDVNIVLAVFNLIPIPPLDGSKIFALILPKRLLFIDEFLLKYGNYILLGLLLFSTVSNVSIFSFLYDPVIQFVYRIVGLV